MNPRGISVIEVLIASAIVLAISGALAAVVEPMRDIVVRAQASADLDAGPRASLQQIAADLREAGGDAAVAPAGVRLARVLPRVLSLEGLETNAVARPGGALRVQYAPRRASQGVLIEQAFAGDTILRLDTSARCATGPPACGFRGGEVAVLYTSAVALRVTVAEPSIDAVTLAAPLRASLPAGTVLTELVSVGYGTRPSGDGSARLVRLTSAAAEQPLVDNVVDFEVMVDHDDPLLVQHVALRLRLQVPSAELRGPAGYLFRRGGTSTHVRRWVPDVELRTHVALRNPAGAS